MVKMQIGNRSITSSEIISRLSEYQLLPQFRREFIIDEAIAPYECTSEEVATALSQFYSNHQISTPQDKEVWLKHRGISAEQLEAIAVRELRIEKFKQATWGWKIESLFLQHKSQLDRVVFSLLRTQDMEVAQELYFRIKASEQTFADCAREYSQGSEANMGGLVGPVPISQPHPAVAQKLAISQPGQLWPPMQLENWVVILRLEKTIAAQLDDPTRSMLLNHLFEQWLAEEINNAPITLDNETLTPALALR